jgi:hypothetical protein
MRMSCKLLFFLSLFLMITHDTCASSNKTRVTKNKRRPRKRISLHSSPVSSPKATFIFGNDNDQHNSDDDISSNAEKNLNYNNDPIDNDDQKEDCIENKKSFQPTLFSDNEHSVSPKEDLLTKKKKPYAQSPTTRFWCAVPAFLGGYGNKKAVYPYKVEHSTIEDLMKYKDVVHIAETARTVEDIVEKNDFPRLHHFAKQYKKKIKVKWPKETSDLALGFLHKVQKKKENNINKKIKELNNQIDIHKKDLEKVQKEHKSLEEVIKEISTPSY